MADDSGQEPAPSARSYAQLESPDAPPSYSLAADATPQAPPQPRARRRKAIVALVLGVMAWITGLSLLCSIPAWLVGRSALRDIRANPEQYKGKTAAEAGMWLGILHTVLFPIFAIVVIVLVVLS